MTALRKLFELSAGPAGSIDPSQPPWLDFLASIRAHNLLTPLFQRVLDTCALSAAPLRYEDLALTAAALVPEAAVDKTLGDLQSDSSALRRFVAHVRAHAARGSSERRHVESGAEDVAGAYRATLLRLLRLAVREAEAMDAMEVRRGWRVRARAPLRPPHPRHSHAHTTRTPAPAHPRAEPRHPVRPPGGGAAARAPRGRAPRGARLRGPGRAPRLARARALAL